MPEITALAREIFAAQPFTALLGAELTGIGEDWAEISITMQKALQQQHGYAHGGVISYLADNALTFAGGMSLGGDALTAEFKINYVAPGQGREAGRPRERALGGPAAGGVSVPGLFEHG